MTFPVRLVRRVVTVLALLTLTTAWISGQTAPAPKTPSEAYTGYRAALLKAKTLDQVKPWLSKEAAAQMDSMPADQRGMILGMIQEMSTAITNVKVTKETITGDKAVLEVQGTDTGDKSTKKAMVDVAREGGVWKFVKERWGSS